MKVARWNDGWHVEGVPEYFVDGERFTDNGPYDTKREAEEIMRGLQRTLDIMDDDVRRLV